MGCQKGGPSPFSCKVNMLMLQQLVEPVCSSVCLSVYLSEYLSVCMSVYMSVCMSALPKYLPRVTTLLCAESEMSVNFTCNEDRSNCSFPAVSCTREKVTLDMPCDTEVRSVYLTSSLLLLVPFFFVGKQLIPIWKLK